MEKRILMRTVVIFVLGWVVLSGCGSRDKSESAGTLTSITSGRSLKSLGSWNPDGNWLVYSERLGENDFRLSKIDVQSQEVVNLLKASQELTSPAWSPKGNLIAFGLSGDVWMVGVDGSNRRQLTYSGNLRGNIVWNSSGDHLYVHNGSTDSAWSIYYVNAQTGEGRELIKKPPPNIVGIGRPRPKGGIPAWGFTDEGCWLYEINPTTGAIDPVISLPPGTERKGRNTWLMKADPSPDGRFVVYQEGLNASGGIWLIRPDGTDQRRIVSNKQIGIGANGAIWSPNYDVIAFVVFEHDPEFYGGLTSEISLFRFDEAGLAKLRSEGGEKKE